MLFDVFGHKTLVPPAHMFFRSARGKRHILLRLGYSKPRMENSLGADTGAPEVIERDGTGTEHPAKLTKVLGISDEKTKSSRTNRRRVHDYIITMLYTTDPRPQPLLHSHRHILPKNYYAFKRYT